MKSPNIFGDFIFYCYLCNVNKYINMTQEYKKLLINDLCARLECGVIAMENEDEPPFKIVSYDGQDFIDDGDWEHRVEKIRPYLFPLTSMTKEQKEIYNSFFIDSLRGLLTPMNAIKMIDWLNKNHFDYRDLILKGLAIDATTTNVYLTYNRI